MLSIVKSPSEELRLELSEFRGTTRLNLRVWYEDRSTGEMRPSRDGFTLRTDQLEELIQKLTTLRDEGRTAGILPSKLEDL